MSKADSSAVKKEKAKAALSKTKSSKDAKKPKVVVSPSKVKSSSSSSSKTKAAKAEAALKTGQRHPTPTPGFGDRVFYESLLRQKPKSFMAQEWCVAYGVLPEDEALKLYPNILKLKKQGGLASVVSPASKKKALKAKSKKKKSSSRSSSKRKTSSGGVDVGLQLSGGDGIGIATF
jgi:hypothetical protein